MASPTSTFTSRQASLSWLSSPPARHQHGMKRQEIAVTLGCTTEDGKRQCPVTCTILSERVGGGGLDRGEGEGVERARTPGRRFGEHET